MIYIIHFYSLPVATAITVPPPIEANITVISYISFFYDDNEIVIIIVIYM